MLIAGCSQPTSTAAPAAGTTDPNSVTVFTLALQPDSVTGCIMGDPGMTRPMTLTVRNNSAVLLTGGGIHYDLDRIRPNVYAGGYWIKIVADLSVRPKRSDRQQRRRQLQLGGDGTLTLPDGRTSCAWT